MRVYDPFIMSPIRNPARRGLWPPPLLDDVSYRVVSEGRRQRRHVRARSRLRTGKLVDAGHRFLCDCVIHDRSVAGMRLSPLNYGQTLPTRMFVFDDLDRSAAEVGIVWLDHGAIGVAIMRSCGLSSLPASVTTALQAPLYAVTR